MKFVHIADMHFDTSFTQIKDGNLGTLRRIDQRKVFKKVIDYVEENNIDCLFIAGDLYEHKFIRESTIEFINEQFKRIRNTKVFIAPGNHDPYLKNSFYAKYNWSENVCIFGSHISKVELCDVDVYGYGFNDFYYTNPEIDNFRVENPMKTNILVTHATLNGTNNIDKQYNAISKSKLQEIGFDYVALGHIHKANYNEENRFIYPGSTISMGFDEPDKHGMIVGDVSKNNITTNFVALDDSEFVVRDVDVSDFKNVDELVEFILNMDINENNYYEIYLVGQRCFDIDMYNLKKMIISSRIIKIKNKTKIFFDFEKMSNEYTLKGLFVKEILSKMENCSEDEQKILESALEIGMEILDK